MAFHLEHARTLDALARLGSIAKAAEELHKVHSAIVYTMKSMEELTELKLFDRSGYRTQLTSDGRRIWQECQKMLEAERHLEYLMRHLRSGWEPYLRVVFDGFLPFEPMMRALQNLEKHQAPTQVIFYSEYLAKVEEIFEREKADIMLSVLPPENSHLREERLPKVEAVLVAHKDHALAQARRQPWALDDLRRHTFLTVRGSDFRLQLSTAKLEESSQFHLGDFHAKKSALLNVMGYGWMPKFLIEAELENRTLRPVKWSGQSTHQFQIYLSHRGEGKQGRASQILLSELKRQNWSRS